MDILRLFDFLSSLSSDRKIINDHFVIDGHSYNLNVEVTDTVGDYDAYSIFKVIHNMVTSNSEPYTCYLDNDQAITITVTKVTDYAR